MGVSAQNQGAAQHRPRLRAYAAGRWQEEPRRNPHGKAESVARLRAQTSSLQGDVVKRTAPPASEEGEPERTGCEERVEAPAGLRIALYPGGLEIEPSKKFKRTLALQVVDWLCD